MIRADRAQRVRAATVVAGAIVLAALGCEDATSPLGPAAIPCFVYVSDSAGIPGLVSFQNNASVRLTSGSKNTDPNIAANRMVFTSERDGYPQVYISDLNVTTPHRVMSTASFDRTPALIVRCTGVAHRAAAGGAARAMAGRADRAERCGVAPLGRRTIRGRARR